MYIDFIDLEKVKETQGFFNRRINKIIPIFVFFSIIFTSFSAVLFFFLPIDNSIKLIGIITCDGDTTIIPARTSGVISHFYAKNDDLVFKGELLASLTIEDLISQLEMKKFLLTKEIDEYSVKKTNLLQGNKVNLSMQEFQIPPDILMEDENRILKLKDDIESIQYSIAQSDLISPITGRLRILDDIACNDAVEAGAAIFKVTPLLSSKTKLIDIYCTPEQYGIISMNDVAVISIIGISPSTNNRIEGRVAYIDEEPLLKDGQFSYHISIEFNADSITLGRNRLFAIRNGMKTTVTIKTGKTTPIKKFYGYTD